MLYGMSSANIGPDTDPKTTRILFRRQPQIQKSTTQQNMVTVIKISRIMSSHPPMYNEGGMINTAENSINHRVKNNASVVGGIVITDIKPMIHMGVAIMIGIHTWRSHPRSLRGV